MVTETDDSAVHYSFSIKCACLVHLKILYKFELGPVSICKMVISETIRTMPILRVPKKKFWYFFLCAVRKLFILFKITGHFLHFLKLSAPISLTNPPETLNWGQQRWQLFQHNCFVYKHAITMLWHATGAYHSEEKRSNLIVFTMLDIPTQIAATYWKL